jgi:hypothetical protein
MALDIISVKFAESYLMAVNGAGYYFSKICRVISDSNEWHWILFG